MILHPASSAVNPTRSSVGVVVGELVRTGWGSLVYSDIEINVKLHVSQVTDERERSTYIKTNIVLPVTTSALCPARGTIIVTSSSETGTLLVSY
jgi:hypothetical protein